MEKIKFHKEYTKTLIINEKKIQQKIVDLIILEGKMEGEISIIFCTDDYLLKINKDFLNHDYYTDKDAAADPSNLGVDGVFVGQGCKGIFWSRFQTN